MYRWAGRVARVVARKLRDGAAITADTREGREFGGFGRGSALGFPQGPLTGVQRIRIGSGCIINEHTALVAGLPGADLGDGPPMLEIGDRCVLGRNAEILAMRSVALGDDVWFASRVTIVDHHHRHDLTDVPVAAQWPLHMEGVTVGSGTVISTGAVVLAGAHIGENSMVASGSQVRAGIYPPNSVLAGVPARVIRTHEPERDAV